MCRDGTVRLDRRYIQAYDHAHTVALAAQGSGWGKFGTGTLSNQYVAVLDGKLYEYDLTQATISRAQAGAGLAAGDWFWQQFANYLYGVNVTAGMGRKLLGPGNNGHGDWATLKLPDAPANAPTAPPNGGAYIQSIFTGGTVSASGSPVVAAIQTDGSLKVGWSSSAAGAQTITFTFKTSATDNRPDWTYHDAISFSTNTNAAFSPVELDIFSTALGTGSIRAQRWTERPHPSSGEGLGYRISNIARSNRAQVTKLVFNLTVPTNGGQIQIYPPFAWGVILTLDESTSIPINTIPAILPLQYEYTKYDSATGLESPPSPQLLITVANQNAVGEWRDVTCTASGPADKIRVYRRIDAGGGTTRYRLAELPNTGGTQVWTDKLAADEVIGLPIFSPSILPPTGVTAITSWLNRNVIAVGPLCYISRDDNPLAFAGPGQVFDASDEGRALTFYPDDKQAETILAYVAQDGLFIITDQSVRCLFGTTPDNWRNVKVDGAEGAVGPRAVAGYKRGVLVFTASGRLMYHTLSLTSTYQIGTTPSGVEISAKVRAKVGDPGIKALATPDAVVTVRPDGEIEVRNNTGAYYVLDVDGNWRKGTHTHPTHSVLYFPGLPLRWIGVNGYLYQGGDDSYVSDGGTTGVNGTPAYWSITTKEDRMGRAALTNIYIRGTQTIENIAGQNTVTYPGFNVFRREGSTGRLTMAIVPNVQIKRNRAMKSDLVSEEFYYKIDGDKDTVIKEVRADYELQSPAKHL